MTNFTREKSQNRNLRGRGVKKKSFFPPRFDVNARHLTPEGKAKSFNVLQCDYSRNANFSANDFENKAEIPLLRHICPTPSLTEHHLILHEFRIKNKSLNIFKSILSFTLFDEIREELLNKSKEQFNVNETYSTNN